MTARTLQLALAVVSLFSAVSAHTQIFYPEWRGDSFLPPFSQRIFPCAGINDNKTTPRTLWPLDGGSLNVTLHDGAAYIWINLGLGLNTTNFNYTLLHAAPLNETGAGNLCFPKITIPPGLPIQDGTPATLQFATAGDKGDGLYNCADITFSKNATLLPAQQCQNSSTIVINELTNIQANSTTGSAASPSTSKPSNGVYLTPSLTMMILIVALAASL